LFGIITVYCALYLKREKIKNPDFVNTNNDIVLCFWVWWVPLFIVVPLAIMHYLFDLSESNNE